MYMRNLHYSQYTAIHSITISSIQHEHFCLFCGAALPATTATFVRNLILYPSSFLPSALTSLSYSFTSSFFHFKIMTIWPWVNFFCFVHCKYLESNKCKLLVQLWRELKLCVVIEACSMVNINMYGLWSAFKNCVPISELTLRCLCYCYYYYCLTEVAAKALSFNVELSMYDKERTICTRIFFENV